MTFTLFVILPNEDVCSLRNIASGTSIRTVRKKLELWAGLPAQTYRLTCPQEQLLHEDHVLKLDSNVWEGFVLRAVFLDSWQELYEHIVDGQVEHVIQHGAVHMRSDVGWVNGEEEAKAMEVVRERGVVALFVASFLGMMDMCKALLSVGVNPNGKTPFGRTPLFAAMSRDNDHVMEVLLSYQATLEMRDVDGTTAVDVARRLTAKQCMRKVRHLQLQTKGNGLGSATGSRLTSSRGSHGQERRRPGPRVIRIPSGAPFARDLSSLSNGRPPTVKLFRDESPDRASEAASDAQHPKLCNGQLNGKSSQGISNSQQPFPGRTSRLPHFKPASRQGKEGEQYTWENNLTPLSRAPSAAGTHVRTPVLSSTVVPMARGRDSRATKGEGTGCFDSMSVSSASARMLPFRPTVYNISAKGPSSVLTTTSTATTPLSPTATLHSADGEDSSTTLDKIKRSSSLVKFCVPPAPAVQASSANSHQVQEPHEPAQEPPERPPSRLESNTALSSGFEDQPHSGSVGNASVMGSQEALSVGSAPELLASSDRVPGLGAELRAADQGESDDDGGRVLSSRGKSSRTSGRFRSRLLVSRQKQEESWRTMKRRIKLAEEQKRSSVTKAKHKTKIDADTKENFDQWLERKRKEQRSQRSSDEDSSEDEEDAMNRSAENSKPFNDWLKDLKERPLRRPHTSTPASLHRRKTRPLKDLIQVGGSSDSALAKPDPDTYMAAYREWQHRKTSPDTRQQSSITDIKEAKRQLEEKRKSLLAMALTYEDWLEHAEERKQLMQAILRADLQQLATLEHNVFPTRRAPRQISFNEWREKVDKKEAEMRHQRHRMRREAELRQQNGYVDELTRSSAAIAHEEWVKRKKEEAVKSRSKDKLLDTGAKGGNQADMSEDEKQAAWEAWLEQKHKREVAQLDQHLRKERQLLLTLRQKKTPTVSQC